MKNLRSISPRVFLYLSINKIIIVKNIKKNDLIFVIFVSIFSVVLFFLPTGFENQSLTESALREKAKILEVDNSDLRSFSIVTTGTQDVKMVILSGKFKGDTVKAKNVLMGQKRLDKIFKKGDKILAILQLDKTKEHYIGARADDYYRLNLELILFLCFATYLVFFARWTGFKAILSFIFTALTFWKILIPLYLKGYSPICIALFIVILTTTVITLLVSGINRKGLVALLGTVAGISITATFAIVFGYFFKIPGTVQEYSETLLYTGFMDLNLSEIFISVIFISAAGAVMDVAMDISAAQNEIILKIPYISKSELIKSGFHIAQPVIGTMTTTLLFAYSGSFMFVFMVFMTKGTPMISIANTNYISAEILHTLVGSFGLVLVAPITAIIGGYIYSFRKKDSK